MKRKASLLGVLKQTETIARGLEMEPRSWRRNADAVADVLEKCLAQNKTRPAFSSDEVGRSIGCDERLTLVEAVKKLTTSAFLTGSNHKSNRNFAYFVSGGLPAAGFARFAAAVTNGFSGKRESAPGPFLIESSVIQWLVEIVGFPKRAFGNLTSGGSGANLAAIVVSRDHREANETSVQLPVVYLSELAHGSIFRALHVAGLSRCPVRRVPVDEQFRMDTGKLAELIEKDRRSGLRPWLLVATAGTTAAGSIDPLGKLSQMARHHGMWLHVDAAYGGMFVLTREGCERLSKMGNADSITINPHKGLFIPHGVGAVLVRNAKLLTTSFSYSAEDCITANLVGNLPPDPSHCSWELTRPFRGAEVWLPLVVHGKEVFEAALQEKLLLARFLYDEVNSFPEFEVGPEPDLSVVLFRLRSTRSSVSDSSDGRLQILHEFLRSVGFNQNIVELQGKNFLRFAVLNYSTHLEDIESLLHQLKLFLKRGI